MSLAFEQSVFLPRPHERVPELLDALTQQPLHELGPDAKREVLTFEDQLFEGKGMIHNLEFASDTDATPTLIDIIRLDDNTDRLAPSYFLTTEGKQAAAEANLTLVTEAQDEAEVARALTLYCLTNPGGISKNIVGKSLRWTKNQYEQALTNNADIEPVREIVCAQNPNEMILKLKGLMAFAHFLRQERRGQEDADLSPIVSARRAIIDIYMAKVNDVLASTYPTFLQFNQQVEDLQDAAASDWAEAVRNEAPRRLHNLLSFRGMQQRFAKRLDAVRNGLAVDRIEGHVSRTVSSSLPQYFESTPESCDSEESNVFSAEELERLKDLRMDASDIKVMLESALAEQDLLSSDEYDIEKDKTRKVPASDGKWQVAISSAQDSLSVNGNTKVMTVGGKFNRSFRDTVAVGAHEMRHVDQHQNNKTNQNTLRLVRETQGKRYLFVREAGGVERENITRESIFGEKHRTDMHYMRALLTYEETGDELKAMISFRDSMLEVGKTPEEAAERAVDRVRRITRRHGGFNSQPLMYVEQELLVTAISGTDPQLKRFILEESALDLPDLVRLHEFGLVLPNVYSSKSLADIFVEKAVHKGHELLGAPA